MIGRNRSETSRISTSNEKTSRRIGTNCCSYQQLERRNLLTTFVVTTVSDVIADDGLVSLREAITAANTNLPFSDVVAGSEIGDRIVFSREIREQRITIDGELQILDDLVIRGYENSEGFKTSLNSHQSADRIFNIDTNERVYLRDLEFGLGVANEGGLVKVNSGGNVTFKGALLRDGFAQQGGAVHSTDARLVFDDTRIIDNEATDIGGGIRAEGGEVILWRQSFMSTNVAAKGGGIFADNGTRVYVADSTFEVNYSVGDGGGAIWAGNETTVEMNSSLFEFNGAHPHNSGSDSVDSLDGGAIKSSGESLRIVDSRFFANNAGRGGAVFSTATKATFVESEFDQNRATRYGGGAWLSGDEIRFNGGRVASNTAARGGGGLAFSTILSNTVQPVAVVRNVDIAANSANSGGGVLARGVDFRLLHSTVTGNFASTNGGGLRLASTKLYALDTTFSSNGIADFGEGGAISSFGSLSFIDSSTFSNNVAFGGGGIATRALDDMTLRSTLFESNQSKAGGAAVMVGGNSTFRSFASTFDSNTSSGGAGAVLVLGTGRLVSRDTFFVSNTAGSEGGAISNYGTVNIASTVFEGNRAMRGGAIKVGGENGLLSIQGTTRFSANIASANGSAISSTTSSITLVDDAEFFENVVEDGVGDLMFIGEVAFHRVTNSTIG